ncbi:MAG: ribosome recycling factor [Microthrixaceae bacterium]|nr:ribosome recycling factor [Microthrixaceae bacterium]MCO5311995.1 ribosome recycling factor [Microthrixaceae bacterium]
MSEEFLAAVREDAEARMSKAVAHARSEFASIRSGRANPGLVERIQVDYYGAMTPLQQLASFSVPEARLLVVSPFDKGSLNAIERAIRESNLGLNPSNDGVQIRLAFPALTEERRKEFVKMAKTKAEDAKTQVRAARRDARKDLDALQKDGEITEDELRRGEDAVDKSTKTFEAEIDVALETKTVELMEG